MIGADNKILPRNTIFKIFTYVPVSVGNFVRGRNRNLGEKKLLAPGIFKTMFGRRQ